MKFTALILEMTSNDFLVERQEWWGMWGLDVDVRLETGTGNWGPALTSLQ